MVAQVERVVMVVRAEHGVGRATRVGTAVEEAEVASAALAVCGE